MSPNRFLRLRAYEVLIFVVAFLLLALCLAAAPLLSDGKGGGPPLRALR